MLIPTSRLAARLFLFCLLGVWSCSCAWGALDAFQIMVVVNRDQAISGKVAQTYQGLRGIPSANVLRLSLGANQQITTD